MGLRHDINFMRERRHLKRAPWPWTKLLFSLLGLAILNALLQAPIIFIALIGILFEWIGDKIDSLVRLLREFTNELPGIRHVSKAHDRLEERKKQFALNSWRWRQFWDAKSIRRSRSSYSDKVESESDDKLMED